MNPSIPSPQAVTQAIWHSIEVQVLGGNIIAQMSLSMSFDFLTPVGKQWVLQKYMSAVNTPSQYTVISGSDTVLLHPLGQGPQPGQVINFTPPETTPNGAIMAKIRRPANAFILYRKDHHQRVKDENPGIHNKQISVILGREWNQERTDIRNHYLALAEQAKLEHLQLHPDYQYRPRRPEEKKRRMTKAKRRKLMERFAAEEAADKTNTNPLGDSDMGFLVPCAISNSPAGVSMLAANPVSLEVAQSVITHAEKEIDMVNWTQVTSQVEFADTDNFDFGGYHEQYTGVTPGVFLFSQ